LSKQEQGLPNIFSNRLVIQQQGAFDPQLIAENGGCQTVIGANATDSYQMPVLFAAHRSQNKFQLSDFIAAIYRRTLIVPFDPDIFNAQVLNGVDRGRESAQANMGQLLIQLPAFAEQTEMVLFFLHIGVLFC
jgi:hypothetical protein